MNQNEKLAIDKNKKTLTIFTAAFICSIFIMYLLLKLVISDQITQNTDSMIKQYKIIFYTLSVFSALASFIVPKIIAKKRRKHTHSSNHRLNSINIQYILSLSMIENVAILGLILSIFIKNQEPFIILGASSLGLMIIHYLNMKKKVHNINSQAIHRY